MGILKKFTLQPADKQDIDVYFDDFVDPFTDSLKEIVSVSSSDDALAVDGGTLIGDMVKIWIDPSAATPDVDYHVQVTARTNAGRERQADILVRVREYGVGVPAP